MTATGLKDEASKNKPKLARDWPSPPDGGWGWFIVFATFLTTTISAGNLFSFSVFFAAYLDAYNESKAATAWIGSLAVFTFTMLGPLSLALSRKFGHRTSLMAGGIVASVGHMSSSFTTNIYQLYFTYGILIGCGFGITHLSAIEMVGIYFRKKLSIAMGLALAGGGMGQFVMSIGSQALIDTYGWRGLHMVLSAFCLHICVAGALFRPLQAKREYSQVLEFTDENLQMTHEQCNANQDECNDQNGESKYSKTKLTPDKDNGTSKYKKVLTEDKNSVSSSIGKQGRAVCNSITSFFKSLYDFSLFKEPVFIILLFLMVFQGFGVVTVTTHIVRRARDIGISATKAAFIPAAIGLGQLIGRPTIGGIGNLPKVKPNVLYALCFAICSVSVTLSLFLNYIAALTGLMVVFGGCMGGYMVLLSVNIAYYLGRARIGYAMSVTFQFSGTTALIVGPLTGLMRDHFGIYDQAFILSACAYGAATLLALVALPLAHKMVKARRRRSQQALDDAKLAKETEEELAGHLDEMDDLV
ncbi:monocarboxylate transporter 12-like isoform X1 [Ptychodera flava]|uniref:monocarboxylate transporter 12-like isoform X1 n=2 Tax=Ptychodera flava TaxID=63121 RepID=UPI00396A1EB6